MFHSGTVLLATGDGQKLWFAESDVDTPSLGNCGSHTTGNLTFGSISNFWKHLYSQRYMELLRYKAGL